MHVRVASPLPPAAQALQGHDARPGLKKAITSAGGMAGIKVDT